MKTSGNSYRTTTNTTFAYSKNEAIQSFWSSSQSFFPLGGLGPPAGFAMMICKTKFTRLHLQTQALEWRQRIFFWACFVIKQSSPMSNLLLHQIWNTSVMLVIIQQVSFPFLWTLTATKRTFVSWRPSKTCISTTQCAECEKHLHASLSSISLAPDFLFIYEIRLANHLYPNFLVV